MPHRTTEQREIEHLKLLYWRATIELEALKENVIKLKEALTFFLELNKLFDRIRDIDKSLQILKEIEPNLTTKKENTDEL